MIDEKSINILNILQKKARIPNAELARQVDLAPSAVLERVRKLEQQGIIKGYEVVLNPEYFNRPLVVFLDIYPTDIKEYLTLGEDLRNLPEAQEVHFISGNDRFLVKLRVAGVRHLGRIITERIAAISCIKKIDTHIALETFKEGTRIPLDDDPGDVVKEI